MAAYPETRTVAAEETLAGVSFPDPFQWLEADTEEVRQWQLEQASLASETVRQWPQFDRLKQSVANFSPSRFSMLPQSAAGRWFRVHAPEGAAHPVVMVSDTPMGEGRVIFDPSAEDPERPPFLSWIAPSPDGRILALGVCSDGSEHNQIRLVDVESGALLPHAPTQTLMDAWLGGAHWLADSSGFFFTGLDGEAQDFQQRIFRFDLEGEAPARKIELPAWAASLDYPVARPSADGRWLVLLARVLTPSPVAILDLTKGEEQWKPFVTEAVGALAGFVVGGRYVAVSDEGAPRSRVVAIALDSPTPNDPSSWEEIVPQGDAAIRSVRPVGDRLYVTEFVDTYARVRIFTADGRPVGEVPMPGQGALDEPFFPLLHACQPIEANDYLFSFSSLTASWGLYRHRPDQAGVETLVEPQVRIEDAVVEDHWAVSADGTRVPYHIVRLPGAAPDRPQPTLIHAYGGFNYPLSPQFPGPMAAFAAAGGLFVHCHIRGGSEFGRDWWEGGRLKNKQNCYQDLYAIAEDLIARGRTRADLLALSGLSNGGLLSGVAAVQRPDLWAVVAPRVPLMDLIGACRDPYGHMAVSIEFADPDDPDEVRRLALFSPYQMVEDGKAYPAIYIDAGDTDPRCPPWHARKFAARMQAASASGKPILLHIWSNVGHGLATSKDVAIDEQSEWLAFVMQQLEMTPGGDA